MQLNDLNPLINCFTYSISVQNVTALALLQIYWHQRADGRHGNPPPSNQELLVVKDKVGRPPGELWVSKSMECDIFPFSALTLLLGRKGIRPVKNWMLVCRWWWIDRSFARLI